MTARTEMTTEVLMSSGSTNSSHPSDEVENSRIAIYISVPVAVTAAVLITLSIFLVIRCYSRRNIRQIGKNTESEAIYSGNDIQRRNRRSVPGIENQMYCTHILESQEGRNSSDSDKTHQTTLNASMPVSPNINNFKNNNFKAEYKQEDGHGCNHLERPTQDLNNTPYSYVTSGPDGFRVGDDASSYSDITNQEKKYINEAAGRDTDVSCMHDKCNSKQVSEKYENISGHFDIQSSVYDYTLDIGSDPGIGTVDEYYHANGTREHEKRNNPRHSYVNVTKENDHLNLPCKENDIGQMYDHIKAEEPYPIPVEGHTYSHLNEVKFDKSNVITTSHKYVNVTKENGDNETSAGGNRLGEYEEAVGHTPTYFMIQS